MGNTAYENNYYKVIQLAPPEVVHYNGAEETHNWVVLNKEYDTEEGTHVSLPAAIHVADMYAKVLAPPEVVGVPASPNNIAPLWPEPTGEELYALLN